MPTDDHYSAQTALHEAFALRAELLDDNLFQLFARPAYFPELESKQPCILQGGRGTGKTTVLRGLSYQGQYRLTQGSDPRGWRYYGIYLPVNTMRVRAFEGGSRDDETWLRLFGHYLNVQFCLLLCDFLTWFEAHAEPGAGSEIGWMDLADAMGTESIEQASDLRVALTRELRQIETVVNDPGSAVRPQLTTPGTLLETMLTAMTSTPAFAGKQFYFLIDEYENFSDYQQVIVNTLIKAPGPSHSFKVGVREQGWRQRSTLSGEHLNDPADFALIDIDTRLSRDGLFQSFAREVCTERLKYVSELGILDEDLRDVETLLPTLAMDQEAAILGVEATLRKQFPDFDSLSSNVNVGTLDLYVLLNLGQQRGWTPARTIADFEENPGAWETRIENYRYSSLFSIRRGKRGINKYYSGWNTHVVVSGNNIRYLLQLVYECLRGQLRDSDFISDAVRPDNQTRAAHAVGQKNLRELQGVEEHGTKLYRIVLGLGRVFEVMAAQPWGHAPEVNEFEIDTSQVSESDQKALFELVRASVQHLAFQRLPATKVPREAKSDTRLDEYRLHPVFTPYFVFSHRKKRKMILRGQDLLALLDRQGPAIERILARSSRTAVDEPLPEQLGLFEHYYAEQTPST